MLTLTSFYKKEISYALAAFRCNLRASASPRVSYYMTRTRLHQLADDKASFGPSYEPGSCISGGFRILVSLDRPP